LLLSPLSEIAGDLDAEEFFNSGFAACWAEESFDGTTKEDLNSFICEGVSFTLDRPKLARDMGASWNRC